MPVLLVIIAVVLHLFGLPIWASVLITHGGQVALFLVADSLITRKLHPQIGPIIGGALIGMSVSFVGIALGCWVIGHPSW